jgi:hypothetical protein
MMGQLMQQFAQTQQENWGMGSMNGVGMGGMQDMQNMQHRYPGERETDNKCKDPRSATLRSTSR